MRKERKSRWIRKFKVLTQSDTRYTVSIDAKDRWGCSCPKWIFKKGEKCDCHHIAATKKSLKILQGANTGELIMGQSVAMTWTGSDLTGVGERLVDAPEKDWVIMLVDPNIDQWVAVCFEVPPVQRNIHERTILRFYNHPGAVDRYTGESVELSLAERVQGAELGITGSG